MGLKDLLKEKIINSPEGRLTNYTVEDVYPDILDPNNGSTTFTSIKAVEKAIEIVLGVRDSAIKQQLDMLEEEIAREESGNRPGIYHYFDFSLNTGFAVPALTPDKLIVPDAQLIGAYKTKEIEDKYLRGAAIGYSDELNGLKVTQRCRWINVKAQPYNAAPLIAHFDANQLKGLVVEQNGKMEDYWRYPAEMELTGQFVDNPDGRWHFVVLTGAYRQHTKMWADKYKSSAFDDIDDYSFIFRYGFVREDLIAGLNLSDKKIPKFTVVYRFEVKVFMVTATIYVDQDKPGFTTRNFSKDGAFERYLRPVYAGEEYPQYFRYPYEYLYNAENGISYTYMLLPRWGDILHDAYGSVPLYPLSQPRIQMFYNHGDTDYIQNEISTYYGADESGSLSESVSKDMMWYAAAGAVFIAKMKGLL